MSSIRAALVKGRSNGDPVYLAAEDTAKSLKERIGQIHTMQTHSAVGTGISPARVKKNGCTLSSPNISSNLINKTQDVSFLAQSVCY